jgi:hypothetical protein
MDFVKSCILRVIFSPNFIRMIKPTRLRWAGHIEHMGQMRNAHNIFVGNPVEQSPLGRPTGGCKDNTRI